MEYTVEVYKLDKRYKEGQRLTFKQDYTGMSLDVLEKIHPRGPGRIVLIHETYVTKHNLMGGAEFRERYDTPHFCSPASESYWSM
jgi:hypothetical protein